jgi:hypothetical protein
MLKNLARAYELNEQFLHAITALKTYLERNPESGEGEAIQRRIEALERKYEDRKIALAAAAAAAEEDRRRKELARGGGLSAAGAAVQRVDVPGAR